jgi:hypothetical protein
MSQGEMMRYIESNPTGFDEEDDIFYGCHPGRPVAEVETGEAIRVQFGAHFDNRYFRARGALARESPGLLVILGAGLVGWLLGGIASLSVVPRGSIASRKDSED